MSSSSLPTLDCVYPDVTCLTRDWMTLARTCDPKSKLALEAVHTLLRSKRPEETEAWRDEYIWELSVEIKFNDVDLS